MTLRVAAILAGGASHRFGADKAMALLAGAPMCVHVAAALGGDALAVVGHPGAAALLAAKDLRDAPEAIHGPLAGVLAALEWAQSISADWLFTAPCDTPLLTREVYEKLVGAAEAAGVSGAYAYTDDGMHALCAVWRPALAVRLRVAFAQGVHPPVRDIAPDAVKVWFAESATFVNVNTPADLAAAQTRLERE